MSSPFTCVACGVVFSDPELQRSHYKTDWHRYNLKRKVAELPPVSSEEFARRVLLQRNIDQHEENKKEYCLICRKSFGNKNAFLTHKNSKKHKENEKKYKHDYNNSFKQENISTDSIEEEEIDSDEWDEDTENPIDKNNCLFCAHHSSTLLKCLKHMAISHSFFIPDAEFCVDLLGLLRYLGEKIMIGHMCIWCNEKGKSFYGAQATRQHMIDKGHCKMLHEGETLIEYADFYDYSSSYPDADEKNIDHDEEINIPEIDGTDYQLALPSGKVIGHRSLLCYYKQKINPNLSKQSYKINKGKLLASYRILGWTDTKKEITVSKARDLLYMQRLQSKWRTKLSIKANKLQKHFRMQGNF
ncbi:zinc finger protein 622 [Agrilus planipennis]|uniref:Zinc finger protein 622 n=1 Tax=Agrilus planipennis TaxID=224129 RepID=A0A1W4X3P0_AGRPL|nr:zinc finger protein 622 [Agrilus planipennis]